MDGEGTDGELIYIKPMMLGNEPPDVTSYHCAHPSFPHQSTAEQWFDESQTESYRMRSVCISLNDILSRSETADQLHELCRNIETGYLSMEPDPKLARAIQAGVPDRPGCSRWPARFCSARARLTGPNPRAVI